MHPSVLEMTTQVCVAAEKEYGLEKALAGMKEEWASLEFEVKAYKETGTFLVSGVDEIITLLDDHIVKTQTMRGSPYILPIEIECKVSHEHRTCLLVCVHALALVAKPRRPLFQATLNIVPPLHTQAWEFRLKYAQGLVDEWINCQRTWLYLEPIFCSEDIMRQLPTEARRFNSVDQLWRKVRYYSDHKMVLSVVLRHIEDRVRS